MTYLIRPHESDCEWREVERVTDEMRRDFEVKQKGDDMSELSDEDMKKMRDALFLHRDEISDARADRMQRHFRQCAIIEAAYLLRDAGWSVKPPPPPPYHWLGADAETSKVPESAVEDLWWGQAPPDAPTTQEPDEPRESADSINAAPAPRYYLDKLACIAAESYCVGAPRWKDLSVSRQTCWRSSVHAVLETLRQERAR